MVANGRTSNTRSRNGCRTCRIRHVKCDETHPCCSRCIISGMKCDGYEVRPRVVNRCRPSPRSSSTSRPLASRTGGIPNLARSLFSKDHIFSDEREYCYFAAFKDEMVPQLSGFYMSSLWDRIVLQAFHESQFVRCAIIGLSALYRSSSSTAADCTKGTTSQCQREYALQQYSKAIYLMQKAISDADLDIRKSLIGCVLVFCFESIQGYQDLAISHVRAGYNLLQEWLTKNYCQINYIPSPSSQLNFLENDLIHAFLRLDLQLMTVVNAKPIESLNHGKSLGTVDIQRMPATFTSLHEAHMYFELVNRRSAHFIRSVWAMPNKKVDFEQADEKSETSFEGVVRNSYGSNLRKILPADPIPETLKLEYAKYSTEVQRWISAFRPLRLFPCSNPNIRKGGLLLQINAIATVLTLESLLITEECAFDKHITEFRAIVSLIRSFLKLDSPSSASGLAPFLVDFGYLPALFIVCSMCRDRTIRREAIRILHTFPRREGLWNSALIAKISSWIMEVEEQGAETEIIPEVARIRITNIDIEVATKSARLVCAKKGDGEGVVVFKKATLTWD